MLTASLDEAELCDRVASVAWPASPLRLVVCDDYFDPRLPTLHAEYRAAGVAWLPLRISGDALWFGPYFDHQPGHACWHCLDVRLARNQPVRAHWRSLEGGLHQGVPLAANAGAARTCLHLLTTRLAQPLTGLPLVTIQADGEMRRHLQPSAPSAVTLIGWQCISTSPCSLIQRTSWRGWPGCTHPSLSVASSQADGRSQPAKRCGC